MDLLLKDDLEILARERPGLCVSLYFPTVRSAPRTQQGPTRLKNLLRRARTELRGRGLADEAIDSLLAPAARLLEETSFWDLQGDGVALFCASGFSRAYHLPKAFAERCLVASHFFLKPLLPLVASDDVFYVLALSQNETRLLEVTPEEIRRLAPADLPASLEAALGGQKTAQYLQYHTASPGRTGALPAVYHGQGVGRGDVKDELRRYLRQVETALRRHLAGRTAPLVLAGAEPLPSIFREISSYPHIAREVISGNPEPLSDQELRDRASQILEPVRAEARQRAARWFAELAGTGRASSDLLEVLPAARQGRVETLFLACDADLWGRLDDGAGAIRLHTLPQAGDEDLLDAAAGFSLLHGAAVYGAEHGEIPGGGELAAIFRY